MVAMRLFADQGFEGVTVRDLSKEADVSIGLINHHFGSKQGLRRAVDDYFLERTSRAIERARAVADEGDMERVAEYQRDWIVRANDEWPQFAAYLRRAILDNSEWGQNLFQSYFSYIENTIKKADEAGRVGDHIDRTWVPLIYLFILLGPLMLDSHVKSILGKSTYEPDMWARFQEQFTEIFWNGAGKRR